MSPVNVMNQVRAQMSAPGAQFEMREVDVRGVAVREFVNAPATMRDVWLMSLEHGDALYVVYEDEHYTYNEIAAQVRSLARALVETYGVGPGDRVAISMRNYPEWIVTYWATVSIGAAVVGMNAWWTSSEMSYGLKDSEPKLLIVDTERLATVSTVIDELRADRPLPIIVTRHDGELPSETSLWADVVDASTAPAGLPDAAIDPDDDATIFYTSGTTGFPKGAQLTHRGSVTNLMNLAFMRAMSDLTTTAMNAADGIETPAAEPTTTVALAPTPLFHVTACNCALHPLTLAGGTIVLMRKWDAGRAIELIEREKITGAGGVPVMSRELLAHPDWQTRDVSSIVGLSGGGAQVQPDLVRKIGEAVGADAPSTGYGLTETHGIVTAVAAKFFSDKPESCGPIVPTLDAKLIDEAGNDLPAAADTTGELCVRGSVVIKGYLNKPEATAEAIQDGWFRTGDIARIDDDGFVFIVDRAKDMVLRGGENVYCSEVETAIFDHPAVAENVVFAVPDDRLGETVGACVVLEPGAEMSVEELQTFVGERIAKFKVPEHVWFRHELLPRNANGKFLKRQVKAELVGE